jgi:translation initiation factor 2 beta subunit (eIF-2beta)/eIF-5
MEHSNYIYLTRNEEVLFDSNYRYKICKPQYSNVVRKGSGIIIFKNLSEFAQQLHSNDKLLMTILGIKLSCQSGILKSTNEHYIKHNCTSKEITERICEFIQEYMLCESCSTPELSIKSSKKGYIKNNCNACGHVYKIEGEDKCFNAIHKHYLNKQNQKTICKKKEIKL